MKCRTRLRRIPAGESRLTLSWKTSLQPRTTIATSSASGTTGSGEGPMLRDVHRNGVIIMLKQFGTPGFMRHNEIPEKDKEHGDFAWDAYLWIDDADALHAKCVANGVKIVRPICDQEYQMREFDIEDCNGFRLCFGHDISK